MPETTLQGLPKVTVNIFYKPHIEPAMETALSVELAADTLMPPYKQSRSKSQDVYVLCRLV
jgi:hypothetical protein